MSTTFHAYAASAPHAALEPLSFDPGELGPEEVEIQVSHCGICHSDLSMLDNEWGWSTFSFVPGHEAVGTVVALGQDAKGLKIGQRVGVGWFAHSCLFCYECLSGDHNRCARGQGTMVGRHGGFADRLRVQWTWARPLPDALDLAKQGPAIRAGRHPDVHFMLSSRTRGLVGAAELARMKPTARLINASRGPIVEEQALISVLKKRQIAGAAVDAFDIEPLPPSHPFRTLDNVLATPHIGYVSQGLYKTFYEDIVSNIQKWLDAQHQ